MTDKYPEAVSVVQQVNKMISDFEILSKLTSARVGGISQWTTIVKSAENRVTFCKFLDGNPLFSALYGMYMVILKELHAVLKVNTQTGQSGAVNKTSLESTT
jgi:hypothetical protein